jgi:hypothetical protein
MSDPIGTGKYLPTSRPPVSVPVVEWQALQKPSEIAFPRRTCSGVPSTFVTGAGALRACSLNNPTMEIRLIKVAAVDNTAATPAPLHLMRPFLVRQASRPDQASSAATSIKAARAKNSSMVCLCIQRKKAEKNH